MPAARASAASVVLIGAALAGVAFGAGGGSELGRTTMVEVALVLAGGLTVAAVVLWSRPRPMYGAGSVVLLAALAALTGISITWSVAPELSFTDTGRMLAYLAAFTAAVAAARLAPKGSSATLKGVLLAAVVVLAYALASRVWPSALAENELSNRIGAPFGYWNAVGTTAAMAVVPALWLGSRRGGTVGARALAYPALGLAVLALLLTQSRGALVAAILGAGLWLLVVPLRLRSLPVLIVPALGAAPVAAWALSKDAFAKGLQPLSVKESVAGEFGALVVVMSVGLLLAGLAVGLAMTRTAPPVYWRRRVGIAALLAACAIPLVLFTSVASSDRGLGGTIDDRLDELTSETADQPAEGASRLTATSSSRASFWREAGRIFDDRPLAGTGANTFSVARLRHRKSEQVSRHAHGFLPQTLADLGLVGAGVALALLAAWIAAAARTTGLYPRLRRRAPRLLGDRRDWDPERIALVALTLTAVVFGMQSAIDWTWFVPGPAVMALTAAGFVAGRGPVRAGVGPAAPEAVATEPGDELREDEPRLRVLGARLRRPSLPRVVAAAGVLLAALLCAWALWQPERSERLGTRALELIEQRDFSGAIREAEAAEDADPLSPRPLLIRAAAETASGRERRALGTLERTVLRFPGEPQTWLRLASFQLGRLDRPARALETVRAALYLDPKSKAARRVFFDARARQREQRAARRVEPPRRTAPSAP